LRRCFSDLVLARHSDPDPVVEGALGQARESSPVAVARKSRVLNVMRLPRAKVMPQVNADG
jgi:hypothetical protein